MPGGTRRSRRTWPPTDQVSTSFHCRSRHDLTTPWWTNGSPAMNSVGRLLRREHRHRTVFDVVLPRTDHQEHAPIVELVESRPVGGEVDGRLLHDVVGALVEEHELGWGGVGHGGLDTRCVPTNGKSQRTVRQDEPLSGTLLAAVGEPTRRSILELLRDRPGSVAELAGQLPVTRPAVSQHLKVLKDAGLVRERGQGDAPDYPSTWRAPTRCGATSMLVEAAMAVPRAMAVEERR